ncbi:putative protein phosphatase 2C 54 [Nymphaea thermarum]|nr:putative protein phosphatase 2C 54 [Nymphaea thermarum]
MCVKDGENMADRMGLNEEFGRTPSDLSSLAKSPLDSISENAVAMEKKHDHPAVFIPAIRSGEWSDIGKRVQMEDTHICIADLAKKFGSLLVANAGDCRAVLSRLGAALEMSRDHRPCCIKERKRIESLGGHICEGYLNGRLGITRALGDWHIKGMKDRDGGQGGPLSAEPELKMITLTKDDEFLIIGSDGVWESFTNQNAVDFARRRLQEHNDVKQCCKELVEEAIKRGSDDNLTVVMVCFQAEPPVQNVIRRPRGVRRSISAEGLSALNQLLTTQFPQSNP